MAFKSFNFYSTVSNIQNIKTQISHYEYWNENDNDVTAAGYFPETLGLKAGDRITVFSDDKEDCAEYYVKADGSLAATGLTVVKADLGDLGEGVQEIEAKIPDAASDVNQLADKAFVASALGALAAKVPDATLPTSAGSYKLVVSVAEDVVTYTWEALA